MPSGVRRETAASGRQHFIFHQRLYVVGFHNKDFVMSNWDKLVEEKIKDAMKEGAFDDLPGKGQPINLEENPFEDPSMRTAHRLLRNNGFSLPWIEERKEIEASVEGALADLMRSWRVYQETPHARRRLEQAEADWQSVLSSFRKRIAGINRSIAAYNLKAPSPMFHRLPVDAEREIGKVARGK
ncbi:MAG: DnaJ family domain-containing protein [Pyrinomonadaceae bacterium]